ncbi:NUC156 family protein [Trypanosoma grayi]|uniref:NUC156 family protein n=1 Tax=Trypanosoma grayi TaxID=71804 RepID=UPI0004F46FC9|nr:NUC156 family protein [Trypanosoma grayi]KEG07407.1 NUC156 family protein [Trypanosoma grayi]
MFFETHVGRHGADPCHHTLLCLNGPITIQGPCGVMGFGIGEVAVGGFYIGRKQIVLHSDTQKVVMTPVTRLKNKSAGLESLPVPVRLQQQQLDGPIIVVPPSPLPGNSYVAAAAAAAGDDNDDENNTGANEDDNNDNVEVFGTIDWNWVEATVASWRGRFASKLPSVVLIVQPYDPCGVPPTRRHFFKRCPQKKQNQKKQQQQQQVEELPADAFIDVPRFVARRHEPGIDAALLPEVIPAIIKHNNGTVVVLGSQGIGKSTLARFLANGLLSQHGVCYWLDLDLGRPEFGPPGTLSLHRVCRPLLRPSDTACVELVRGHYLGGARLRCPLAAAAAVERLCAVVELLQRRYPVVVNTHGWVLSTGRRMTVEAIRRLQPRHIIHLVKEREQRWARDSEVLMHPANGLNSEVLHNRFLVHRAARSQVVGRFPHPHRVTDNRGAAAAAAAASATEWCGTVHTVQVKRDEGMLRRSMQPKASALRHAMWQQQLAPIFNYYEAVEMTKRRAKGSEAHLAEAETTTTLFKGMLSQFEAIVFTDVADARSMTEEAVCAALEHSVVALSFRIVPAAAATKQQHQQQQLKKNYRCLADMPAGFPFSCFGVVESSEAAMRASNEIHIRLPLPRDVVRRMLTTDGEGAHVRLSLACTLADRADTAALEAYL